MISSVRKTKNILIDVRLKAFFWLLNVLLVYFYLYFCIFYGKPLFAFDHLNYINFLNDPHWNFFEPGYTFFSIIIYRFVDEELRFAYMFALSTLPPLILILINYLNTNNANSHLGFMIFACILIKSFYIGFVAQRFFFAELWLASLIIFFGSNAKIGWSGLVSGMFHFSALTITPSLFFLNSKFSLKKYFLAIIILFLGIVYIKFFSEFKLFFYDYSRYLDPNNNSTGNPIFSILQIFILAGIAIFSLEKKLAIKILCLIFLVLFTKLSLGQFEVISRVFQIQIDLVIIIIGLNAIKNYYLTYVFCIGFFLLQVFLSTNSHEMWIIHNEAFSNALTIL